MCQSRLSKILTIIVGFLLIIVGVMALNRPVETMVSFAIFLGAAITASGILNLVAYFTKSHAYPHPGWLLATGIFDILIGVLLLGNIGFTAASLPFILALWIMFAGVSRLAVSIDLKHAGFSKWWVMLTVGILGLILSIVILFMPTFGAAFFVAFIAIFMMYLGFSVLFQGFMLKVDCK